MSGWEKCNEYCLNGISAKVYKSQNGSFRNEKFDLGIFFGSFESRALKSSELLDKHSLKDGIIVFFDEAKDSPLRKENDKKLLKKVRELSHQAPHIISDVSLQQIDNILSEIFFFIKEKIDEGGKIFFDIGGAPIPFLVGFLGYLKTFLFPPAITFFNPTADYEQNSSNSHFSFTSGFFENILIPYFWGEPNLSLPRKFIFMLGHEGSRSLRIYQSCEPDMVDAVITDPGYKPEYPERAIKNNKLFLEESGLAVDMLKRADAADIVAAWRKLLEIIENDVDKFNICLVPLGTKGHAIGCALCALSIMSPAILYQIPRSYSIRDVPAGKEFWKYEINL